MAKIGELWQQTQGLRLQELVRWRRRMVEEKKCYTEELTLKETDPVKFEVLFTRLLQSAVNARELAKMISASNAVREIGEITVALYTPEGDCVCLSCGVLLHVHSLSWFLKFMMEAAYEENPGIRPGDIFLNNDPHIGGFHAPDILIGIPIFYGERLVGWAGSMTHVPEVGAVEPGGLPASATSRFQEGLFFSAVKIGTNDTLHRDIENTIERNVRDPSQWLLDTRAKVAAARHVRETVLKLIDQYGPEYYVEAVQEYIEDTRRAARRKMARVMVPGRYRARGFLDGEIPNGHQALMQINLEVLVDREGNVSLDYEGTSPEEPLPLNMSVPATDGAIFCNLIQYVFYDCHFNDGITYAVQMKLPESLLRCSPFASTVGAPGRTGGVLSGVLTQVFSRAYYMGGHPDDAIAPTPTSTVCYKGGVDQYGRRFGFNHFELIAMGTGGRATGDGAHASYAPFNPEGDSGDVEVWEREAPILYLGRRLRMDGGGFGKYRGGSPLDSLYLVHGTRVCESGMVSVSKWVSANQGLMGGYPAPSVVFAVARDTNIDQLISARQPLPHFYGDPARPELVWRLKGTVEPGGPVNRPATPRKEHDAEEILFHSGAGFGDPIERDPTLVLKDVLMETTSRRAAEQVYGVIIRGDRLHPAALTVDVEATAARRAAIRAERKRRGRPARQYLAEQRERIVRGEIPAPAKRMINRLLSHSAAWAGWYRAQWNLPADFAQVP